MTKVTKIAATLAIAFATSSASAADFDGFYLGGGAAFNKLDVKFGYDYTRLYLDSPDYSRTEQDTYGDTEHSADFAINAGYAMSFGNFNVAVELGYTSGYGEAEMYSYANSYGSTSFWRYELTGGKSLSVLPGYKLGQDTLVYGRLGAVKAKGKESWDDGSESHDFSGMIWGIGMKHAFTNNLMAVLEYQATKFDEEKTDSSYSYTSGSYTYIYDYSVKPASNGVTLGVQYMF